MSNLKLKYETSADSEDGKTHELSLDQVRPTSEPTGPRRDGVSSKFHRFIENNTVVTVVGGEKNRILRLVLLITVAWANLVCASVGISCHILGERQHMKSLRAAHLVARNTSAYWLSS